MPGFKTPADVSNDPVAPSDYKNARALTHAEIKALQEDYMAAAMRAKTAGFDGIELHGAHGYLISQFLSPETNKRTDEYGGSPAGRLKFVTEIITSIRAEAGDDFIIGCRIGGNEPSVETRSALKKREPISFMSLSV